MAFKLEPRDIDTLQWVLRCYLADREVEGIAPHAAGDVQAMLAAAARDRQAVRRLLQRLDAYEEERLPAATDLLVPATAGFAYTTARVSAHAAVPAV